MTFSREQNESSVDTSASFARESVKPDSLLVPCYARDSSAAICSARGSVNDSSLLSDPDELDGHRFDAAESRLILISEEYPAHQKMWCFFLKFI